MHSIVPKLGLYVAGQVIAVSAVWYLTVPNYEWHIVQQFIGHLGPAAFLVSIGAVALFWRNDLRRMVTIEAWLAIAAGGLYVLGDTFLMHPPLGVFDGAGLAEEEHVAIMGLIFVLGVSVLLIMRRMPAMAPMSMHFVIGIAVAAMIFLNHHQHTVAGAIGHQATLVMLAISALFRVLEKTVEYAFAVIAAGYVFFSSQMGFAMYVDMAGNSGGAWVGLWSALGFASATGFLALIPREAMPAE